MLLACSTASVKGLFAQTLNRLLVCETEAVSGPVDKYEHIFRRERINLRANQIPQETDTKPATTKEELTIYCFLFRLSTYINQVAVNPDQAPVW
jgi:hypothetical protein